MSTTLTKNILLSRPNVGTEGETHVRTLPFTSSAEESFTVFRIEIPGVDPSTVSVGVDNNTIQVSCPRGGVTLPVSSTSDSTKIEAEILWGMLTLRIPLPQQPAAHMIKVAVLDQTSKTPAKSHSVGSKSTSKEFTSQD
jgi:hypothetical protein